MIDISAARKFVQRNGRLLDRRRLAHLLDQAPGGSVEAAVAAYANPDGGYAGLIEPDVRTLDSQPIAVLTAFELLHEVGASVPSAALDWLASISNADGGIPFHLPSSDGAPQAPWMQPAPASSLHMTAAVTAAAARVEAEHPWVNAAAEFCRRSIDAANQLSAYETKYMLALLDATGDTERLAALGKGLPRDGRLPVEGGAEGETLDLLTLCPRPDRPSRRLFDDRVVDGELDGLEKQQRLDGGWDFDWLAWEPAVATEWRARLTVDALTTLNSHGRLESVRD